MKKSHTETHTHTHIHIETVSEKKWKKWNANRNGTNAIDITLKSVLIFQLFSVLISVSVFDEFSVKNNFSALQLRKCLLEAAVCYSVFLVCSIFCFCSDVIFVSVCIHVARIYSLCLTCCFSKCGNLVVKSRKTSEQKEKCNTDQNKETEEFSAH